MGAMSGEEEVEEHNTADHKYLSVTIHDNRISSAILKVREESTASDICKDIAKKVGLENDEGRHCSLVLVATVHSPARRFNVHYVKSLHAQEHVLHIQSYALEKLVALYHIEDQKRVLEGIRWFYKDSRSAPIDMEDTGDVASLDPYDEDEEDCEVSQSDLSYLAKAERKGYLLKRSNRDPHLWYRRYCVLMDNVWCVDISRDKPRATCVKLNGSIRYKDLHRNNSTDSRRIIVISSDNRTHYFMAENEREQQRWVEELSFKSSLAAENNLFSMAEFIMSDEELVKSQRLHEVVLSVLNTPVAVKAVVTQADQDLPPVAVQVHCQDAVERKGESCDEDEGSRPDHSMTTAHKGSVVQQSVALPRTGQIQQQQQQQQYLVDMGNFKAVERCVRKSILHSVERKNSLVAGILSFLIDVQKFKELYRHDLFMSEKTQLTAALLVLYLHIIPQIKLSNARLHEAALRHMSAISIRLASIAGTFGWRNGFAAHVSHTTKLLPDFHTLISAAGRNNSVTRPAGISVGHAQTSPDSNGSKHNNNYTRNGGSNSRTSSVNEYEHIGAPLFKWSLSDQSVLELFRELFGDHSDPTSSSDSSSNTGTDKGKGKGTGEARSESQTGDKWNRRDSSNDSASAYYAEQFGPSSYGAENVFAAATAARESNRQEQEAQAQSGSFWSWGFRTGSPTPSRPNPNASAHANGKGSSSGSGGGNGGVSSVSSGAANSNRGNPSTVAKRASVSASIRKHNSGADSTGGTFGKNSSGELGDGMRAPSAEVFDGIVAELLRRLS